MDTLIKFRMMIDAPFESAPPLDTEYDFVYINNNDLAQHLGSESTGSFYIYDKENKDIIASNKIDRKLPLEVTSNLNDILYLGKLIVKKIVKWTHGGGKYYYTIWGTPELEMPFVKENDVIKGVREYLSVFHKKYGGNYPW